jgi:hypothetical protein
MPAERMPAIAASGALVGEPFGPRRTLGPQPLRSEGTCAAWMPRSRWAGWAGLINSVYVMNIYHHWDTPSEHLKQDPDSA